MKELFAIRLGSKSKSGAAMSLVNQPNGRLMTADTRRRRKPASELGMDLNGARAAPSLRLRDTRVADAAFALAGVVALLLALASPVTAQGNATVNLFEAAWAGDSVACVQACNRSLSLQCNSGNNLEVRRPVPRLNTRLIFYFASGYSLAISSARSVAAGAGSLGWTSLIGCRKGWASGITMCSAISPVVELLLLVAKLRDLVSCDWLEGKEQDVGKNCLGALFLLLDRRTELTTVTGPIDGGFGYITYDQQAWHACYIDTPLLRADICTALLPYQSGTPPPSEACTFVGRFTKFPFLDYRRTTTKGWCCGTKLGSCDANAETPRCDTSIPAGYWGVGCCDSSYVKILKTKIGAAGRTIQAGLWMAGVLVTILIAM